MVVHLFLTCASFSSAPTTGKLIIGIYRVVVFGLIPINLSEIIGVKTAIQHNGFFYFLELLAPKNKATKQQKAIKQLFKYKR